MIAVENLSIAYPDGHVALESIDINIKTGDSVAIIGANGAGKSTLLMSIVGVMMPKQGRITAAGIPLSKKNLKSIRAHVGYVFQNPDDQLFMTRVYDDVAFAPRNYGLPETEVAARTDAALNGLGISHLRDRAPYRLSGGEKRSVALACVLSMQPDILLLDEPSASLDPRARRRLIEMLIKLPQTKLIATHDLDLALELCSRAILLKDGHLLAQGNAQDILTNTSLLDEAGLELPLCLQRPPYDIR